VRTEDLLPEPNMTRALLFAGGAAFAGAAVWAALAIYANVQIGWIAWGVGALIGLAMVKGGGHGQMLAVVAAVLAVLAIGTGRYATYQAVLDEAAQQAFPDDMFDAYKADATAWKALGASPTDEQVTEFALDREYDVDSAAEFRMVVAPRLNWLAESERTLADWRTFEAGNLQAQFGFVEYLKEDFHPLDILFVLLGLGSAFGIVSRHTTAMQVEAREQIRAEREAEAAAQQAAAADADGADEGEAPRP
jgi:hypothetical protein